MSSLEIKARNSYAIVALNNLRHQLENRDNDFNEKYKDLILDSIKLINEEPSLSNEYFSYSIHGLSNVEKSSAIQLSEALENSVTEGALKDNSILTKLKNYIVTENITTDIDKAEIINVCKKAINFLSGRENASGNIFITYDI